MILAIDTSCYTTSVALMSMDGKLLTESRKVLSVVPKKRGLAQSEALFQHIHNTPEMLEQLFSKYTPQAVKAVCASVKPRPRPDSYMPVFLASEKFGRTLAAARQIPFLETTHQEGHFAAAVYSSGVELGEHEELLFVHFSGGTSEICRVRCNDALAIEIESQGNDLHAGQFVDRVGVAMDLPFPAGPELEKLAAAYSGETVRLKTWVTDTEFSFSGPESAAQRLLANGAEFGSVARSVETAVAATLAKALQKVTERTGLTRILLAGGVMANLYMRNYLQTALAGCELWFAAPKYASDNAVGVACRGVALFNRMRNDHE